MASNLEVIQGVLNWVSNELNRLGGTQQVSKNRVAAQEGVVLQQLGNAGSSSVITQLEIHKKACDASITALLEAKSQLNKKAAAIRAAARAS